MTEETLESRARAYLEEHPNFDDNPDELFGLANELAEEVARLKIADERKEIEAEFTPENAGKTWEALSPSGEYRLVVTDYHPQTDGFHYTRGVVFRKEGDGWVELPQDIKRNYHSFAFSWVEGHANGHSYLVGGA